jgi:hypothetical protein
MQAGRLLTSGLPILALLSVGGSMALAQNARPWVDPPGGNGAAPQMPVVHPDPAPAAPPAQSSQPLKPPPAASPPEAHQAAQPQPAPPAPAQQPEPSQQQAAPTPPQQPAPAQQQAAPAPAQQPGPAPSTRTAEPQPKPPTEQRGARANAAKEFAIDYLASWSARNDVALDATAELYAPRVLFHGRTISLERLYKEKQRFIRRWPEREYRPRQDAIGTECNPAGTLCTVHAVFDYTAANPKRGRVSQGSGALQLIVEFIGEKPVIIAENSTVLQQTRKHTLASEGTSNE